VIKFWSTLSFFLPTKSARTANMKISCDPEVAAGSHRCCPSTLVFVTFDCVHFQRNCNVTNLERVNLLQEQVAVTLLDPHNIPDLNCIPRDQHDQDWTLLHGMVIAMIDDVKNSNASTDVNDSIEMSMISWSRPPPLLL